jgi:small-conductance mechanosensitive channel
MFSALETFVGLADLPVRVAIGIEVFLGLVMLAIALAVRRRRRSLTPTTFIFLAVSFGLSVATHLIPNDVTAEKVGALAVVALAFGLIRLVLEAVDAAMRRRKAHFSTIFKDLIMLALWGVVIAVALNVEFGVKSFSILTSVSVLAAVVGFAAQEALSNVFSGLTMQLQRPFKPGDWVRSGNYVGRFRGMNWRSTTIITRANERLEVPNSVIGKDVLVNYGDGTIGDQITIGISYDVPPNRVREVAIRLLHNSPHILKEPAPEVLAWEFGDFAIQYKIKYWLDDYGPQENVRDHVVSSLWYVLRRHAIEIPYPIRSIDLRQPHVEKATRDDHRLMTELRQVDFLRGLTEQELNMLVPSVQVREYGAGETIVRQGDEGDSFYIIRRGTVEVLVQAADGSNRRVAEMGPPSFVGEAALMTGQPRNATNRAKTDVELIEIDREGFTRLFQAHPEVAEQMSEIIATRLAERLEVLDAAGGDNGKAGTRRWLMSKMKEIFDF